MGIVSLHGLGINYKTSIVEKLETELDDVHVIKSSSESLMKFRRLLGIETPVTTYERLLSFNILFKNALNSGKSNLLSDRSSLDILSMALMNFKGYNFYYDKSFDHGIEEILKNGKSICEEECIDKRIILMTDNIKLLESNINQDNFHNKLRFDLYENVEMYFDKQNKFIECVEQFIDLNSVEWKKIK
jgi:hypothetical protein